MLLRRISRRSLIRLTSCTSLRGFAEEAVARGINIKKGGSDPPLKPIAEYPDWVQSLSVPPKTLYELKRKIEAVGQDNLEWGEALRYMKLENRATVKQQNSLKAKK